MNSIYPTLVSNKFVETINFYEDFFGFVPVNEQDGYALLQHSDNHSIKIAIFDVDHACVHDRIKPVQGLIIALSVPNVEEAYQSLYMEGLDVYKDLSQDVHDRRHFVVYDPNGVLINVVEPFSQEMAMAA
jgi:catechol 2,3-dioxygenase-like lactoylglutathione lyase family enzyme